MLTKPIRMRGWRPKLTATVGISLALAAVWAVEPWILPLWITENPLTRGLTAFGLALLGAGFAYLVMVIFAQSWTTMRRPDRR